MERSSPHVRPPSRRKALGDANTRANIGISTPQRRDKHRSATQSSGVFLPHHESLSPNGQLSIKNVTSSPENKRLSNVTSEEDSKRNSQVSTTSTSASTKGRRRKTHIGPWQLGVELGKGGCGRVRKVRHSMTGQEAAAKIISKKVAEKARAYSLANLAESSEKPQPNSLAYGKVMPFGIEREVVIMKLLEHPNVVRLFDVWENRNELYLIMEYVEGGELFDYVEQRECLDEDETVYLFRQVIAALLHCNRLGIHHRDLKPENILLDPSTSRIKLVDFGMAALQPKGKFLTTPCGSIHYAAPDVLEQSYDGSKADVWSCGIILYVMLTGTTPFQYDPQKDVSIWYRTIRSGKFPLPDELSSEARDLIKKILVPDSEHRLSLEGVWNHPLLHKYDKVWGWTEDSAKMENWIGPRPIIENWTLKERSQVDREILRNLRTLWHSEKEETLIEKLLNEEPNQEKYFYAALQKHREEQLENYVGSTDGVGYSTSDHHHIGPVDPTDIPPLPTKSPVRTKSQFSILNDEHLHSRSSLGCPTPSVGSYDPYRASRRPVVTGEDGYMNITVHREGSRVSRKQSSATSQRRPTSQRISALKYEHRFSSDQLTPRSVKTITPSQRSSRANRRSASRSSIATSSFPSSPPVLGSVKPNVLHKRAVKFGHSRRSSTASAISRPGSVSAGNRTPRRTSDSVADLSQLGSSPALRGFPEEVRSRKENLLAPPTPQESSWTNSQIVETEARKVSTELEMFCQQAFFRTSDGSSGQTSKSEQQSNYETPPSSVSNRASGLSIRSSVGPKTSLQPPTSQSRPLPDLPPETPNSYIARELEQTRSRLAARFAQDDAAKNPAYQEVLSHLEALLQAGSTGTFASDTRRITSAPEPKPLESLGFLPIISEEGRAVEEDESPRNPWSRPNVRATTDPLRSTVPRMWQKSNQSSSIRLVSPPALPQVAPLNIRKRSRESAAGKSSDSYAPAQQTMFGATTITQSRTSHAESPTSSDQSQEIGRDSSGRGREPATRRKKSWFRWKANGQDEEPRTFPTTGGNRIEESGGRMQFSMPNDIPDLGSAPEPTSMPESSGFGIKESSDAPSKKGLMRFWGKRTTSKEKTRMMQFSVHDAASSVANASPDRRLSPEHAPDSLNVDSTSRDLGIQQNWLSRFLHIRPATKVVCLQIGRGRARQEIVRLLRSWGVYGIRDVVYDRATNVVYGRLDRVNYLQIKEVAFMAELFVVLEHGRRANMSLMRFTQRKGAASSFRRVVDTVEQVLKKQGMLVNDKERYAELCEILG